MLFLLCTVFSVLMSHPALPEVSGMVAMPGTLLMHNDSGDGPYLHSVAHSGRYVNRIRFTHTRTTDTEAMAMEGGVVYIGDTGRNLRDNALYTIYRWPRGGPIHFRFPDNAVYDVEAMLVVNGTIMVIQKASRSNLWVLKGGIMEDQGQLMTHNGRPLRYVTDAARDGETILIRSIYPRNRLFVFDWSSGTKLVAEREVPVINEPQGEAVAIRGETYWTMSEYERGGYSFLHRYEDCLD